MKDFVEVLNNIFNDQEYMLEMLQEGSAQLREKMAVVLKYYLATRDTVKRPYNEIEKLYKEIKQSQDERLITNSAEYLTTAFNGYKKEQVEKKGLNSDKENPKIKEQRRADIELLEHVFGKTPYAFKDKENAERGEYTFLGLPSSQTFYYAYKASPERLFEGPFKHIGDTHFIGETKKMTYRRKLENGQSTPVLINAIRNITETYLSKPPVIALVKRKAIKNAFHDEVYEEFRVNIGEDGTYESVQEAFGLHPLEGIAQNLVTTDNILPEDIQIIQLMDLDKLFELMAIKNGAKIGDVLQWGSFREPRLQELAGVIKYAESSDFVEQLKIRYKELYKKQPESVKKAFKSVDKKELLRTDKAIVDDSKQYSSRVHGKSHTRRVNFFAQLLMNEFGIEGRDREIIIAAVRNHDIGRKNDIEDKEHGSLSFEKAMELGRLDEFTEQEHKLLKFIISGHSKSKRENQEELSELEQSGELPSEKVEKYRKLLRNNEG